SGPRDRTHRRYLVPPFAVASSRQTRGRKILAQLTPALARPRRMSTKDKKKLVLRAIPLRQLDAVVGGRSVTNLDFDLDTGAIRNALTRIGGGLGGRGSVSAGTNCCPGPVSGTDDGGPKNCDTSKSTACKTDSVCMPCA
ncbi:MAG: hypothetical protein ABW217_20740, partial [Polyangiaceae bacterium]